MCVSLCSDYDMRYIIALAAWMVIVLLAMSVIALTVFDNTKVAVIGILLIVSIFKYG